MTASLKMILNLMIAFVFPGVAFAAPAEYSCKGLAAGYQEVKVIIETSDRPKIEISGTMEFVSKEMSEKTESHLYPSEIRLGAQTFTGLYLEKDQNNQDVVTSFFLETWPVGQTGLLLRLDFGDQASYGREIRVTDIQSSRFEPQFFCELVPSPPEKPIWQFVFTLE